MSKRAVASLAGLVLAVACITGPGNAAAEPDAVLRAGGVALNGEDTDYLTLGGGAFNVVNDDNEGNDQPSGEIRFEYRWGRKLAGIGPTVGMLVNARGSLYGYGGFYSDIQRGRWVVTPILGLGGYGKGSGDKDLSGVFHFTAAVDISYRMDGGTRVGVKFAHISNAGIHDRNPGAESILFTFTFPIDSSR